ncbi:hypothetical protein GOODEAATRI_023857, partial [Goodea atripinnis]
ACISEGTDPRAGHYRGNKLALVCCYDKLLPQQSEMHVSDLFGNSFYWVRSFGLLNIKFENSCCTKNYTLYCWWYYWRFGTKRKSERSGSQDLKRLRPSSGHAPSRSSASSKRGLGSSLSSKKVSSPRSRHTTAYHHDYYEERKRRRAVREGAREGPRGRVAEEGRRRESQRGLEGLSRVMLFTAEACTLLLGFQTITFTSCLCLEAAAR